MVNTVMELPHDMGQLHDRVYHCTGVHPVPILSVRRRAVTAAARPRDPCTLTRGAREGARHLTRARPCALARLGDSCTHGPSAAPRAQSRRSSGVPCLGSWRVPRQIGS